jgi:hypothetical protein
MDLDPEHSTRNNILYAKKILPGFRRAKMSHKSEENSSFEVLLFSFEE